ATQPPLRALSEHYHRHSWSPRRFPTPIDGFVEFVRAARPEAVVFYYYVEEEALTWDHVPQREALDALSVPWLCLSMQPYPPSSAIGAQLAAFFEQLSDEAP
ncbi:MAG TPA: hypothetical protein VJV79_16235, partial [Polyangiaceae bacterium]|nr:hypothetical protein [Polyangiaceae bacterium]